MSVPCEIKQQAEQPVLSIRTRTSISALPQALGRCYGLVLQRLGELGAAPAGAPFIGYYNQDMNDLDVEIGFPVAAPLPGKDDVQPGVIPGGQVATYLHIGPYDQLAQAYETFMAWAAQQGLALTEHMYEFYLNDPEETPPDQLQTLIVFPVKE